MSEPPEQGSGAPARGAREIPPGYRMHNGELVPAEQPAITRLMPAPKKSRSGTWRSRLPDFAGKTPGYVPIAATLVALLLFLLVIALNSPQSLPEQERHFLTIVKRGQDAVRHGNDVTLVTAKRRRAEEICELLPRDLKASKWQGTVSEVGTVSGSEAGDLRVAIGDGVEVKTWTSPGDDKRDHTLVSPKSPLYDSLAKLRKGEKVTFTGTFAPRPATCVQETSIFAKNGMLTPDFIFRFTAVGASH
jgi:hypothetical protein